MSNSLHIFSLFLRYGIVVVVFFMAQALLPVPCGAASSATSTKERPVQAAEKQTVEAKAADAYNVAAKNWKQLLNDKEKAAKKANWLAVSEGFNKAYALAPKSSVATKALFQVAKSYDEIGRRFQEQSDSKKAMVAYLRLADEFPASSLSDDALYLAASIKYTRLKQPEEAKALLKRLQKEYSSGDMLGKAKALLDTLEKESGAKSAKSKPELVYQTAPATPTQKPSVQKPPIQKPPVQAVPQASSSNVKSEVKGEVKLIDQLGLSINTIMLDAGHGGKDPGATSNSLVEKKVTLQAMKMLGDKLTKLGFNVIHVRGKDVFIPLQKRPILANSRKADLFISLHVNANNDAAISGLETYYLDVASSHNAVRVAARENGVSVDKISDLQAILADFMLNSRLSESRDLAGIVHSSIHGKVKDGGFTVGDNGVRSAPFYVLMGARMPAVLVEAGYLTNSADAVLLKNEVYLQKLTDGIVAAVVSYKRKVTSRVVSASTIR